MVNTTYIARRAVAAPSRLLTNQDHKNRGGDMTGRAAGELGLILLDDTRQPLSQVRCWVCDQAIPGPLVQEVTNGDIGAIEMCRDPECVGYIRLVRSGHDLFALRPGLIL